MSEVKMQKVKSSQISEIGYDVSNEILYVTFSSGSKYMYKEVSIDTWEGLEKAESVGSYFNRNIRNIYEYQKL